MNDKTTRPDVRPNIPFFSSGPCAKRPGWSPEALADACVGRSHRSEPAKAKLRAVLDRSRAILGIPDDYRIAIVPASDTGAFEMAMWSLLGARGVDVLAWESFGKGWLNDVVGQLGLEGVRTFEVDYGDLPDLSRVDGARDIVFTWNGTTSGVRVPDGDWIDPRREGLTICDATSAVFAMDLPWPRLDAVTWSWQKVLGGEAQHGMLVLSPRAVARLERHDPPWPLPKIFRLTSGGRLAHEIFEGSTINTPSMLCVEDQLDALAWAESLGGLPALIERSEGNFEVLARWIQRTPWVDFLAADPATRSCTSVCLKIVDRWFQGRPRAEQARIVREIAALLEAEGVAYDIAGHRDAPPGLRLWAGATVERSDMAALPPWLDWAFARIKAASAAAVK
ncbi:MAG: phosphoserine transaminase [Alphaproteobacteria bacterium]